MKEFKIDLVFGGYIAHSQQNYFFRGSVMKRAICALSLCILTAVLYASSADCRDQWGNPMSVGEVQQDMDRMVNDLRKHNKFGNDDVMVVGYCQNKTADNYFMSNRTCHRNAVGSFASDIYQTMSQKWGCRDDPKIFLLQDDGTKKELGR